MLRIALNTLIGLALIYAWTKFVNLEEIIKILSQARVEYLLAFVVLYIISALFRALRLVTLLNRSEFKLKESVALFFLSQFLSNLIPIRAGEIAKGVYLANRFNVPVGKALVWSFVDRFIDFWVLFILVGGLLILVPTGLPVRVALICFSLALVSVVVGIVLIKNQDLTLKIIKFLSNYLVINNIKKLFVSVTTTLLEGFQILKLSPLKLGIIIVSTLIAYGLDGLFWFAIWRSIGVEVSYLMGLLGNLLIALTFLLPSAPGFVGSTEASGLAVYSGIFKLEPNIASAGTVLFHLMLISTIAVLGTISLYWLKFDLSLVWKRLRGGNDQ